MQEDHKTRQISSGCFLCWRKVVSVFVPNRKKNLKVSVLEVIYKLSSFQKLILRPPRMRNNFSQLQRLGCHKKILGSAEELWRQVDSLRKNTVIDRCNVSFEILLFRHIDEMSHSGKRGSLPRVNDPQALRAFSANRKMLCMRVLRDKQRLSVTTNAKSVSRTDWGSFAFDN